MLGQDLGEVGDNRGDVATARPIGAVLTFVVAAIDGETKKSRPLPEPIRSALLACVEAPPA